MYASTARTYLIAGTILLVIAAALVIGLIATGAGALLLASVLTLGAGGAFITAGLIGRSYQLHAR